MLIILIKKLNPAGLKKISFMDTWYSNKFIKLREKNLKKNILGNPCQN